jgi:glycosyltransferase involved in cell wall biosynthesis
MGYLSKKSWIIRIWAKANILSFRKAKKIYCISEGMVSALEKYMTNSIPEVVPLWTDNTFLKPIDPEFNLFMKKHDLMGKFVVLYSGNIGLSSNVDALIEVAARTKRQDILFLIIGDGKRKEFLSQEVNSRKLLNVIFLPWQPVVDLPYSLSAASLAVVTQGNQTSKLAVPSKFFNYLSVGAPIMNIAASGSEIELLVRKYSCGKSFAPGDTIGMVDYIYELADNPDLHQSIKLHSLRASQDFQCINAKKLLP